MALLGQELLRGRELRYLLLWLLLVLVLLGLFLLFRQLVWLQLLQLRLLFFLGWRSGCTAVGAISPNGRLLLLFLLLQ